MSQDNQDDLWLRVDNTKTRQRVLMGRKIDPQWLEGFEYVGEVSFTGQLLDGLRDLYEAANQKKIKPPIVALRLLMISRIDGLIGLDRDLGIVQDWQTKKDKPAATLFAPDDELKEEIRGIIADSINAWIRDTVEPWSVRYDLEAVTDHLPDTVIVDHVLIKEVPTYYINDRGKPNYPVIIHSIGRQLIGESLFEGLSPCELVISSAASSNAIELMTLPERAITSKRKSDYFSMVAKLSVVTVPYFEGYFLSISAAKRVWADKLPNQYSNSSRATAYVISQGRPAIPVDVIKKDDSWDFDDAYSALIIESNATLPESLEQAVSEREYNETTGWWAGLQQLPALYSHVSPRTVYEADESSLLDEVTTRLNNVLVEQSIPLLDIKLPRKVPKSLQEMLKLTDFGTAGAIFYNTKLELEDYEEEQDRTSQKANEKRVVKLDTYRRQNLKALQRTHGDNLPNVWMFGGSEREQKLAKQTVHSLFGADVPFYYESLPNGTHGLREKLDCADCTTHERFENRVQHWQTVTRLIQQESPDKHNIILICASDRIGKRPEDQVNYFAGIHASSLIGANVHHVLPIEKPGEEKASQEFLYRIQNALLDVMLAHTGVIFGVKEFVDSLDFGNHLPCCIYGIQVIYSRAQRRSGQKNIEFILYSRLVIETGKTEVRFAYYEAGKNLSTDWMPLEQGLTWLGSQRRIQDSPKDWVRNNFEGYTIGFINELKKNDPHAIVMVDWQTVRSLWRGITDGHINTGKPPQLGELDLTRLSDMTFIRIRHGRDTITLRSEISEVYKRLDDRAQDSEDNWEIKKSGYMAAMKSIVQINNPHCAQNFNCGHYIGSMGYPNTVQLPRGLSCYRKTARMKEEKGDSAQETNQETSAEPVFKWEESTPCDKDASLPAPIDITVLLAPQGIDTQKYAKLVMGLRVGFAHYNDWTKLPAPLFFIRKVRDYIMRYEETGGEARVLESAPMAGNTLLSDLVVEDISHVSASSPELDHKIELEERTADYSPVESSDTLLPNQDTLVLGNDLTRQVQETPLPVLVEQKGNRYRQLRTRMFSQYHHVTIELPYWLETNKLLIADADITKHGVRRSWDFMRDYGYARDRDKQIKFSQFLKWLGDKIIIPQSCYSMVVVSRMICRISFTGLAKIINEEYNLSVSEDDQLDPFGLNIDNIIALTHWAYKYDHDALLAWLIFLNVQLPSHEINEKFFPLVTHVIGPRTEHALHYYMASTRVINYLLQNASFNKRINYHESLPTSSAASEHTAPAEVTIDDSDLLRYPGDDPVMNTKKHLVELIKEIEPGSPSFEETLSQIEKEIEILSSIHSDRLHAEEAATLIEKKLEEFVVKQKALEDLVNQINQDVALDSVISTPIDAEQLDDAETELETIKGIVATLRILFDKLLKIQSEIPRGLAAIQAHNQNQKHAIHEVSREAEKLTTVINTGGCFDFIQDPDSSQGQEFDHVAQPDEISDEVMKPESVESATNEADVATVTEEPQADMDTPIISDEFQQPILSEDHSDSSTISDTEGTEPETDAESIESIEEPDEDEDPDKEITSLQQFSSQIDILSKLMKRRLYGLSEVHVAVLEKIINESDKELIAHQAILSGIVYSQYQMDCCSSYCVRVDSNLKKVLDADKLPSGQLSNSVHIGLGILAAGMPNLLFDHEYKWAFLEQARRCLIDIKPLNTLFSHLDQIVRYEHLISREVIESSHVGDKLAWESEFVRYLKRAKSWKNDGKIHSTFRHIGFASAHNKMFGSKSLLGECVALIANGETTPSVLETARNKLKSSKQILADTFRKHGEKGKIEGPYKELAIENIRTTKNFINNYIELLNKKGQKSSSLSPDLQEYLNNLNKKLLSARDAIENLRSDIGLETLYRASTLRSIDLTLSLFNPTKNIPDCISSEKQKLLLQLPMDKELMPVMDSIDDMTEGLCPPSEVFNQLRILSDSKLTLDRKSEDSIEAALFDAYQGHVAKQRYLPATMIEKVIGKPTHTKAKPLKKLIQSARLALISDLQDASAKVAHAMTLNALPDGNETVRMQNIISELMYLAESEHPPGTPEIESEVYVDYPQTHTALRSNVLQPLENRFKQARDELEVELLATEEEGRFEQSDINRIRKMLDSNNPATLRAAHDGLHLLKIDHRLPKIIERQDPIAEIFDQTINGLRHDTNTNRQLLSSGLKNLLKKPQGNDEDSEWTTDLDDEQRKEALTFIESWEAFFTAEDPYNHELTEQLFRGMSMTDMPYMTPENVRNNNRALFRLSSQNFRQQFMPEDPTYVPPVLGSWADAIQCYVLWGNVIKNDIMQLIHSAGSTPTIILSRSTMMMEDRAEVSGTSPVILIDDNLIAYMAINPQRRMETLLQIGMQTFYTNPYGDYGTKPVPSEMFFGRKQEIERLTHITGVAVLYGGRRLGKTSLLYEIAERTRQVPNTACLVFSLQDIDINEPVKSCWETVYRFLATDSLIKPIDASVSTWEGIRDHIRAELVVNPKVTSLYLMMDEADALMKQELDQATSETGFVRSIALMAEEITSSCNIRIVFAGLHNVTRMANDANSVFGKTEPIALEPFTSVEDINRGLRMITKPLEAMGYIFVDEGQNLAMRILSVCNFYPAFIQMYCKRLVERLQNNRQSHKPPLVIKSEDLDAVEKDNKLLSDLREKFKLNLNLDKRYKAIALILADAYYEQIRHGQNHGLNLTEIRELCETFSTPHFKDTPPSVYEALLDEMIKLNVLQQVRSRYQLRNPHIAMMIGEKERITHLLSELAEEPPEEQRSSGERRVKMVRKGSRALFPMPVSWVRSRLNPADGHHLIILVGNDLSGIKNLPSGDRLPWNLQSEEDYQTLLGKGVNSLESHLTSYRRPNIKKVPRILAVRENTWQISDLGNYARLANKAASIGRYGIRIILLSHPERALEIAQSGIIDGTSERNPWQIEFVPPWSRDAIYFHVRENIQIAENMKAISAIQRATAGFGHLVENLCSSTLTVENAHNAIESYRNEYAPNLETFYKNIGIPPSLIVSKGEQMKECLAMIDGANRSEHAELEDNLELYEISMELFEYFKWMGLVQYGADHTWKIPEIYSRLLEA